MICRRDFNFTCEIVCVYFECAIYLLYLINIHWLSVNFDPEQDTQRVLFLSCRMIILTSDIISA